MLDLKFIREHSDELKVGIAKKKFTCNLDAFIAIDNERRDLVTRMELLKSQQNSASDGVKNLDKKSSEFHSKITELRVFSDKVKNLENQLQSVEEKWKMLYLSIPNIPHESVPLGKNESDNQTIATWGNINEISPFAIPHYDIPRFCQLIDFPRGVKVTGAGFPFYVGDGARVVRALITFFLNEAKANGYTEFMAPIMVNTESATATGQLPDKDGQMYHNTDNFYLIPTAEIPVTNFFRDEIFEESELPIYRCGYTPCFRREAGSWGKDVRGLNRLHQFDKVELVKWTHPKESFKELEKLRHNAEILLQKLNLPYRVLEICTGDIGFSHSKQYDLEVWSGGQKRWLEVSSCSNFTDFQARRAGIKFREKETGRSVFVHTLNGSGLAVPRVLAAILENNFQEDGTVLLPKILREFVGKIKISF